MVITNAEYADLERRWTRAKPFHPSYGHGMIWLAAIPENAWAIARVNELRSAKGDQSI